MIHNVHNNNLIIMIGPVLFLAPTVVDHDWLLVTLVGDINYWSIDQLAIYWSTGDHNAHISCRSARLFYPTHPSPHPINEKQSPTLSHVQNGLQAKY